MKSLLPLLVTSLTLFSSTQVNAFEFSDLFSSNKAEDKQEAQQPVAAKKPKKQSAAGDMPDYRACAATQSDAFIALAGQIRTTVSSEVNTDASEQKWAFFSLATKSDSVNQSVSSSADVIGATIEKQDNGEICVSLTATDALKSANTHIDDVLKINKDMGKYSFEHKADYAIEIITLVRKGGNLVVASSHYDRLDEDRVAQYETAVKFAQDFLTKGALRFTGSKPNQLIVDGKAAVYGETLYMPSGQYSYKASYNNACSQSETFTIEKGDEEVIELARNEFPSVRFNAPGVAANAVTLKLDSKRIAIAELKTINTKLNENCEVTLSWHATAHGQTLSGDVSLEAGDNKEITLDFISPETMNSIAKLSAAWQSGHVIELAGGGWVPSHEDDTKTGEEIGSAFANIQASFLTLHNVVAHGPTFDYSTFNDVESYHLGYQLRLRLTRTGKDNMPFHLFELPIIPFIYGQASVGYMSYTNDLDEDVRTDQEGWKNVGMTSLGLGTSYILSQDFALVAKVQKNFFLDEGVSTYLGASVRF